MAKNFDDFVLWLRDNPEYKEKRDRSLNEFKRKLLSNDYESNAEVMLELLKFSGELSENDLRFYHEWVNRS